MSPITFDRLVTENRHQILDLLPLSDQVKCLRVSRLWKHYMEGFDGFWKNLFYKRFNFLPCNNYEWRIAYQKHVERRKVLTEKTIRTFSRVWPNPPKLESEFAQSIQTVENRLFTFRNGVLYVDNLVTHQQEHAIEAVPPHAFPVNLKLNQRFLLTKDSICEFNYPVLVTRSRVIDRSLLAIWNPQTMDCLFAHPEYMPCSTYYLRGNELFFKTSPNRLQMWDILNKTLLSEFEIDSKLGYKVLDEMLITYAKGNEITCICGFSLKNKEKVYELACDPPYVSIVEGGQQFFVRRPGVNWDTIDVFDAKEGVRLKQLFPCNRNRTNLVADNCYYYHGNIQVVEYNYETQKSVCLEYRGFPSFHEFWASETKLIGVFGRGPNIQVHIWERFHPSEAVVLPFEIKVSDYQVFDNLLYIQTIKGTEIWDLTDIKCIKHIVTIPGNSLATIERDAIVQWKEETGEMVVHTFCPTNVQMSTMVTT